ncbi:MAG: hypothetical protein ABII22_00555 [Candidatus Micrarchaeota archaeon]
MVDNLCSGRTLALLEDVWGVHAPIGEQIQASEIDHFMDEVTSHKSFTHRKEIGELLVSILFQNKDWEELFRLAVNSRTPNKVAFLAANGIGAVMQAAIVSGNELPVEAINAAFKLATERFDGIDFGTRVELGKRYTAFYAAVPLWNPLEDIMLDPNIHSETRVNAAEKLLQLMQTHLEMKESAKIPDADYECVIRFIGDPTVGFRNKMEIGQQFITMCHTYGLRQVLLTVAADSRKLRSFSHTYGSKTVVYSGTDEPSKLIAPDAIRLRASSLALDLLGQTVSEPAPRQTPPAQTPKIRVTDNGKVIDRRVRPPPLPPTVKQQTARPPPPPATVLRPLPPRRKPSG